MVKRLIYLFNIFAILALLMVGGYPQKGQAASPVILEGTFMIVWGDGMQGGDDTGNSYFLSAEQTEPIQLIISNDLLAAAGGPIGLNRKPVSLRGTWEDPERILQVQTISLAEGEQASPVGVYGPQPWVSILCKFKDYPDEPNNLEYFKEMYSSVYPGLDHFWRQNSYNLANLEGSDAFGWYTLPQYRDYYLPGGNLDFEKAAHDCTAVADQDVDFSPFVGINLMFNADLDCCAWGGSWYLCLDGLCQAWRMTWEPPWGYQNIGVIAHETGHGFGLPHSLGNCQGGYDNRWDVLSDVWGNGQDPNFPQWGTIGQHTISYHKEMLEWIKPGQEYIANTGSVKTITLERLSIPQTNNYLGARILINDDPDHFYTLEVRQPMIDPVDYDKRLPGFAVIIHEVVVSRPEPAIVIDQDGNCDTGDAGAMYTPGEVFTNAENGISVSIDSETDSGYVVTINNGYRVVESVELTGASQGYVGESIPFTATVNPEDASTPITYTWEATGLPPVQHSSDIVDTIEFTFVEAGTKVITVTASNEGGSVVDTHSIEIEKKVPIVSVIGPSESRVGELNIFTATVVPSDVTVPITFTWQASGQIPITHTGGLSDAVNYIWDYPGTQVITVTAENLEGSSTDTFSLQVRMPPSSVEVAGAEVGEVNEIYLFTASVDPITTTVPITYVWSVDGEVSITDTAGITDSVIFSWEQPGTHQISVSASNPAGTVGDIWSMTVYIRVFIPMSLRN